MFFMREHAFVEGVARYLPWLVSVAVSACNGDDLGLDAAMRLRGAPVRFPEAAVYEAPGWKLVNAFPKLTFDNAVGLYPIPHTDQLLVVEREGRIYAFRNDPAVGNKRLLLDLSPATLGHGDSGLLGFVFHPQFNQPGSENRSYVYLHYAFRVDGPASAALDANRPTRSRLARFSMDTETLSIDRSTELVLIDQHDENTFHQGGPMLFDRSDGFLYLAVGDEGHATCSYDNCQRLDKDLFAGVVRLDVDRRGGAVSHPPPRQPASGVTQGYYIPNDNPFVGQPGVLEEFYALGLRSPHRMTQDPVDGLIWIGDVGENKREELDVLARGANYQWPVREGLSPGFRAMPAAPIGRWTDPVLDLPRREGRAIIGGYVYRGRELPELTGKYLFADFAVGNLWALPYEYDGANLKAGERQLLFPGSARDSAGNGPTSFGVDAQGELYLMFTGMTSPIRKLARATGDTNLPRLLSETGAFSDLRGLVPAPELVPYSVRSQLYSDGAVKRRWAVLPEGARVQFSESSPWRFPTGTVFVKHFEMALDERQPERRTRLETRFLVAASGGEYYGVTYRWNPAGTDAVLLLAREEDELEIVQQDGSLRTQHYSYPGPADCLQCHTAGAGHALGVRTAQLNGEVHYPWTLFPVNQLVEWSKRGLFDVPLQPDAVDRFPRLAMLDDATSPLEDRLRSYWDGNCSMCHGFTNVRASWDARYTTPLADQGLISGNVLVPSSPESAFVINPGNPSKSMLYLRSVSTDAGWLMPPLGRNTVDADYVRLLEQWILALGAAPSAAGGS